MADFRRILCPVDFSDASRHALDHAVMVAGWYKARITALHVRHPAFLIEPPILFAELKDAPVATLEDVETRLHNWLAPARAAGIGCDVLAVDGSSPARSIVDLAAKTEADLIALGTHGRSGFERLLLGSVTEKVVRMAQCPVITVPPPSVATSTLPFRRILCGIDFSRSSMDGLRFAISLATESNSALTLLHVLEFPQESEPLATLPFDLSTYRAAVRDEATSRLMNLISDDVRAACQPATRLMHGKPYEQILAVADELRSDLIVLGVHGRKAFDMMMFGSTTNQVIRRATCPVLTLNR